LAKSGLLWANTAPARYFLPDATCAVHFLPKLRNQLRLFPHPASIWSLLRSACARRGFQVPDHSASRSLKSATACGLSLRSWSSGTRSRKDEKEAWLPAEKLPVGSTDGTCVRIGRALLPPLWRADENTCCDQSSGCNREDFSLPWPPHEGPANRPAIIGHGKSIFMVARRPIRFAIRCACARKAK
jgi:hypothetical protein